MNNWKGCYKSRRPKKYEQKRERLRHFIFYLFIDIFKVNRPLINHKLKIMYSKFGQFIDGKWQASQNN